ncbi:uncharacterized protein LOC132194378 [Neocloeon triangulifer]|uniref:uncharacterized protein LOC132194378 n=1 Tax=Neocloeon triangulifer TaxID=2078957 RepID=UPI00286F6A2F|nr:uncharacterized protein LOC132194378 [Neocloeon triangulifer]
MSGRNAFFYVDNAYYAALEDLEDELPRLPSKPTNPLELIDKRTYLARKSQADNLKSLKDLCLENVARNMDKIWCKDYVENWCGQTLTFFLGPFELLAGRCIFELMELLRSKNCLHFRYLPTLVTGNLAALNLKNFKNINRILTPIKHRCQNNLRILNLENCLGMTEAILSSALEGLKRLEELNLKSTGVSNNILETIGLCAFPLRYLQLSDNEKITNEGIEKLCTKHLSLHLSAVLLDFTSVDIEGLFKLIESLPKLQVLDHISTTDAVLCWRLKNMDSDNNVLKIRQLKLDPGIYSIDELCGIVTTCPNLTDISFASSAPIDFNAALPFLDAKNLSMFASNNSLIPDSSWFMHMGQSLIKIDLRGRNSSSLQFDLTVIGKSCPLLQFLKTENLYLTESTGQTTKMFESLTSLSLQNQRLSNCVPSTLKIVVTHAFNLKSIELTRFELMDRFFEELFVESSLDHKILAKLQILSLVKCENVTDSGLNHLICCSPNLSEIHFHENANSYMIDKIVEFNKLKLSILCDKSVEDVD